MVLTLFAELLRLSCRLLDTFWLLVSMVMVAFGSTVNEITMRTMRTTRKQAPMSIQLRKRVIALQEFLATDDGANLLIAYRRASKIEQIEGNKNGKDYRKGDYADFMMIEPEEKALSICLQTTRTAVTDLLESQDFAGAMKLLAQLRMPVDAFFEKVTVNVKDQAVRTTRLRLLGQIWELLDQVADFSKIEG